MGNRIVFVGESFGRQISIETVRDQYGTRLVTRDADTGETITSKGLLDRLELSTETEAEAS